MTARRAAALLMAVVVASAGGCGRRSPGIPRFPVSGTVRIDGRPLAKGIIVMEGESDARRGLIPAEADISDGAYSVQSRAGRMRVRISAPEAYGDADATGERQARETVASEFNRNSTLSVEVMPIPDNRFDFEVKGR